MEENNKLISNKNNSIQKLNNNLQITNKLLNEFHEDENKKFISEFLAELEKEKENDIIKVKEIFEKGIIIMDSDFDPNYNSSIHEYKNDFNGALVEFDKIVKISNKYTSPSEIFSEYIQTLRFRSYCNKQLKNYKRAIDDCSILINLDKNDIVAYQTRAEMRYHLQDYSGALFDYNKAFELLPDYPGYEHFLGEDYLYRANCKFNMGDKDGAILDWEKAAKKGNNSAKDKIKKYFK